MYVIFSYNGILLNYEKNKLQISATDLGINGKILYWRKDTQAYKMIDFIYIEIYMPKQKNQYLVIKIISSPHTKFYSSFIHNS